MKSFTLPPEEVLGPAHSNRHHPGSQHSQAEACSWLISRPRPAGPPSVWECLLCFHSSSSPVTMGSRHRYTQLDNRGWHLTLLLADSYISPSTFRAYATRFSMRRSFSAAGSGVGNMAWTLRGQKTTPKHING